MVHGADDAAASADAAVRAWARLIVATVALALGALAYHHHFLGERLPWWRWLVELAAGVALLIVAFARREAVTESVARVAVRWSAAVGAVVCLVLAVRWIPIRGAELESALVVVGGLVLTAIARWRPMELGGITATVALDRPATVGAFAGHILSFVGAGTVAGAIWVNEADHRIALVLWALGLALFVAGPFWRTTPPAAAATTEHGSQLGTGPSLLPAVEWLLLVLVLAMGIALRFFALGDIPTWINSDEGRLTYWASEIWEEGFPNPFAFGWNSFPNLSYMLHYLGVQFLGPSNFNVRLVSAFVGVASLVPVYFWARRWWGGYVGLVAMALLAMNQEHLYWSRVGFNNIDAVLVAGLVLAALARALGTGRSGDWALLGLALGLGFHTYHAAKLYPWLVTLALGLLFLGVRGALRVHARGLVVAIAAMVLTISPQFVSMVRQWATFSVDTSNRSTVPLLVEAFRAGDVEAVRLHFWRYVVDCLYAFISVPYMQPLLDAATAIPFLLGVGWMLWRWRDPRHLVVLGWIGGILVAGGMMTDFPPSKQRMVGFLPALCVVAAVVAGRYRGLLHAALGRRAEAVVLVATVAWLGWALHGNWYTHFVHQAERMRGDVMTNICKRIDAAERPLTVYSIGAKSVTNVRQIQRDCTLPPDPERRDVAPAADHAIVPFDPEHEGGALITIPREQRELVPFFRAVYPNAKFEIVRSWYDHEDLYVLSLTRAEVNRYRGLIATVIVADGPAMIGELPSPYPPPDREFWLEPPAEAPRGAEIRWSGSVRIAAPGTYRFRVEDGEVRVGEAAQASADFVEGWHPIEVVTVVDERGNRELEWLPPGEAEWAKVPRRHFYAGRGVPRLLGRYFDGEIASRSAEPIDAEPLYERLEVALGFDWGLHDDDRPEDWFARRPSTMEWVGRVHLAPGAEHALRLEATTPAEVYLDGRLVLAARGREEKGVVAALPGLSGWVPILVRTVRPADDDVSRWALRLLWSPLGGDWSVGARYAPAATTAEVSPSLTSPPEDRIDP